MASGSQTTLGDYPRVCSGCGRKVIVSGDLPLWFETVGGVLRSWHFACRPSVRVEVVGCG